jgi:hypothetical protein
MLTAISGLLAGSSGIVWFLRQKRDPDKLN